jgi:hypothetical protein
MTGERRFAHVFQLVAGVFYQFPSSNINVRQTFARTPVVDAATIRR